MPGFGLSTRSSSTQAPEGIKGSLSNDALAL
jgi:hypothetical protein